ncbi:MAG TPA: GntR family transcriptional regulator [Bacillota bacterium]|nr:GntR family transcriptional regulator [Bacillota bacterium]
MYIQLDFESNDPIYTQLKEQIIAGIAKRELLPGDALPSVRVMAKDIGINLHTVNKAYQQLKQEGYILIHRQKGVVIHPDGVEPADDAYRLALKKKLHPLIAEAICKGISREGFLDYVNGIYKEFEQGKEKGEWMD